MWDKFIVIGNYAMCKECKIKFRLHSIKPTRSLWQHLTTHHSDKYDVTDKSIKRRKSNVWKEYNVIGNYATCKRCKIKLRLHNIHPTHSLRRHLLIHHPNISNLNNRKLSRSNVWKEYNITGNYAICKECNREIRLPNLNPTRYLWNHLKLDHPYKQTVPDMTNKKRYSDMWDQYIIKGDMITCKKCKRTLKYNFEHPGNLWRHLKTKRCQTLANTKSIEDNDFRGTIPQNKIQTSNESNSLKQEIEITDFNFGVASNTPISIEDNSSHGTIKPQSETEEFDQTNLIKHEIEITDFNFVVTSNTRSIEDNDLHDTMESQNETQIFDETDPLTLNFRGASSTPSLTENNDFHDTTELQNETQAFDEATPLKQKINFNFGQIETQGRKAAEVAVEIQMTYEETFDDASSDEEGDEYIEEHSLTESEENAESDTMDHIDIDRNVGLDMTRKPDVGHRKKKGRPRCYLRTANNFKWSLNAPETRNTTRNSFKTVEAGAKDAARDVTTPLEAWSLLLPDSILNKIVVHTNEEIERQRLKLQTENKTIPTDYHCVTLIELKAFIGLLYYVGLNKLNNTDVRRLWSPLAMPLFKATMQEERFLFLLICLRFDNKETRIQRQKSDNLSHIREMWDNFISNCIKYYEPSDTCTVDEQLFGFRGQCRFRMYIPNKPDKYCLKIISLNDAKTFYMINAIPYVGKLQDMNPNETIPTYYVRRICEPIYNSSRNVTCDNWFTSVPLVDKMKRDYDITIVGKIKKNKPEIPNVFKKIPTEGNSQFVYHNGKTLVSYNPEKRKIVLLLSSLHTSGTIDEKSGKPEIVLFYNKTKGGTDVFNQLVHEYSTCRRTERWPMRYFYGILDQAGINCFILYTFNLQNNKKNRYTFMEELSLSLIRPHLAVRLTSTLRLNTRLFIESILSESEFPENDP
ncbi:uncharacterized protein LOC105198192 isoform X3 [Solenopsis invicta]|nr:uncharacterized protein LOC105198192 isoform X3 [Solenopsis invicta]